MHDIEPHFRWRELYTAEADPRSPFFGRTYSEFEFTHLLYNYYLHPQWDSFGSATLYAKILFADYEEGCAFIELIGEWNDTLHNDIMLLKRNLIDPLMEEGIYKFAFFCDNLLNFHASFDDDYYAEWAEEIEEEGGWVMLLNTRPQVEEELRNGTLGYYLHFGEEYNDLPWRSQKPNLLFVMLQSLLTNSVRRLR
jgi:hypothetical protein